MMMCVLMSNWGGGGVVAHYLLPLSSDATHFFFPSLSQHQLNNIAFVYILQIGSYGNPHSRTHSYGWESESVVEHARSQVASLIGASPKEIIFTSGATESNNLSIKGAAHFYGKVKGGDATTLGVKRHIVTTQTEHKCVLDSCRSLEQEGYEVTYLPVEKATGLVDMDMFESALREDTLLVSIMAVNNEIGTRQPLEDIGRMCRKKKILFHTDGEFGIA
jgi:cysteine desulfurase